ncbi:urease accessory protein [Halopseudomonas xinjiangensis]|uniref:Urease accessory protein UreF n=1 Tax=Halopseudomonas xinjiangensis TaxID=487184 RepID=A0A1H1RF42_9GAMM|nr:urease accessory protein UreF [Halopseudomonas xinjiangensis]SDS34371.1 urease accessory protein [Halopseudomonas xinjiangensis]
MPAIETSDNALLRVLQLASPALPIGGYAYSQGLEYVIEQGWVSDLDSAADWLEGLASQGLARLDVPLLLRQYTALEQGDTDALARWNDWLLASRETAELYLEDSQQGGALLRLLCSLELPVALDWPKGEPIALATAFAMAGWYWQTGSRQLALGVLWSWLENQTGAATKLIPLGQTDAQRLLDRLLPCLPAVVDAAALLEDDDLGAGLPGLAFASARHENQYTRLFRS